MTNSIRFIGLLVMSVFLCACAPNTLYYWGDYETSLYDRWLENKGDAGEQHLQQTIIDAGQGNKKVPPGVCADYGFMLYRRGDLGGAIAYFDKERILYPESRFLMTKLIDKIHEKQKIPVEIPSKSTGAGKIHE